MMKHALENSSIELREVRSDSMESTKSHEPQDNHALSRTGKKPVLKVRKIDTCVSLHLLY